VFLTARGEEIDRIVGLEIGADDYVVKPFSPREVAARVRVILRRARPRPTAPDGPGSETSDGTPSVVAASGRCSSVAEFVVDRHRLTISYLGAPLQLTPHEFRLLEHLALHPGRVFTRGQLLEVIGAGTDPVYERNIDTHVKALRAKLREVNDAREPIQTHRGFGYSYRIGES
jgi:two-component system catabolic regulation response regulator CreB